jgi:four helix bundle protein
MGNFFNLIVWQKAKDLAVKIYKLTQGSKISKDFGLRDQLQRAAVSISANIAEGDELDTDKQSVKHFYIAKGSTAELMTELIIAKEIGYIKNDDLEALIRECKIISTMLFKIIKARS